MLLDCDLINELGINDPKLCELLGPWIKWLADDCLDVIKQHKEQLPEKAVNNDHPFFYWVAIPQHANLSDRDNVTREQINNCVESVIKLYDNMRVIQLKAWDPIDDLLMSDNDYMVGGLYMYWEAIDASLKFNIEKRIAFLARRKVGRPAELKETIDKKEKKQAKGKEEQAKQQRFRYGLKFDPMKSFFRRHQHDRFHWNRQQTTGRQMNNRFILPKPR